MPYEFRRTGTRLDHCTHCPHRAYEECDLVCSAIFSQVQTERASDGVVVNDDPSNGNSQ